MNCSVSRMWDVRSLSTLRTSSLPRVAIVWKQCRIWKLGRVYVVDWVVFMPVCIRQNRTVLNTLSTLEQQIFMYCCIISRVTHVT